MERLIPGGEVKLQMMNKEIKMKNNYKKIILSIVVMLIFMGFTFPANAQVGTNNLFCPAVPYTTGMLNVEITPFGDFPATFTSSGIISSIKR